MEIKAGTIWKQKDDGEKAAWQLDIRYRVTNVLKRGKITYIRFEPTDAKIYFSYRQEKFLRLLQPA